MNRNRWIFALVLAAAFGLAAAAYGQERGPRRERWSPEEEEEARETMLALMSLKMKRALELDEDQERDIMPLLDELMEIRGNTRREQERRMEALRRLVEDPDSSEDEIEKLLDEIRNSHRDMEGRQRQVREEIDRNLTLRQQAKMIFFEARFRREMESRFRDIRRMDRAPRPPRSPRGDRDRSNW